MKYSDPWQEKKKILPSGTVVRTMLTEPKDWKERGLKGHFRAGDTRWTQDQYKIIGYLFDPHSPILYKINQKLKPNEKAAYTREQLQVVHPAEEDVPATITTSSTSRHLTASPSGSAAPNAATPFDIALSVRDPLLDAMAFSRGRFTLEMAGAQTLVLPAWSEIGRVIEDCR
jgi:hypothetical protein